MKIINIIIFFIFLSTKAYAIPPSNLVVIDSLYSIFSNTLIDSIKVKYIHFEITPHSSSWLLNKNLIKSSTNKKIAILSKDSSSENIIHIDINQININYIHNNDNDILNRIITIDVFAYMKAPFIHTIYEKPLIYKDSINKNNISYLENQNYDFTKSKSPPPKSSFTQKYIEPIIFSIAAIITTILLFSVRS